MSTFNGRVAEFPDIRIDYFRVSPKETPRPLAFFLSHVHSDHLSGLDACKSPFVYCSAATKEILLRLEKYPHRMNFAKGILESRKQTYRHLQTLLKPIPLETPTILELAPGRTIRVTLFNANHCTGATMFLIEDDSHAVLYTGDIRSEQWWVDYLIRHPVLIPYVAKSSIKKLNCIYLDTSFGTSKPECRIFPTKQEGIAELLAAVASYPSDTTFYFNPWTFGYEEVWLALSTFLKCKVHVDDYRYGLYAALANTSLRPNEAHHMIGFYCGNHPQEGCLTTGPARVHSCEYGTGCEVFSRDVVRIVPIIARYNGVEISEVGIGGGQGDLDQRHELELGDEYLMLGLIMLCREKLKDHPAVLQQVESMLSELQQSGKSTVQLDPSAMQEPDSQDALSILRDLPIEMLVPALVKMIERKDEKPKPRLKDLRPDGLPKTITFPYSRHASYDELRILLRAFMPIEIYPCTINLDGWTMIDSMQHLFGDLYGEDKTFAHDEVMQQRASLQGRAVKQRVRAVVTPAKTVLETPAVSSPVSKTPVEVLPVSKPFVHITPPVKRKCSVDSVVTPSVRRALQREVHDMVAGLEEGSWADVELISTRVRKRSLEL